MAYLISIHYINAAKEKGILIKLLERIQYVGIMKQEDEIEDIFATIQYVFSCSILRERKKF